MLQIQQHILQLIQPRRANVVYNRNCGKTFSARRGTLFYITRVITLLAYGCPVQAACQAFGLDKRTVADWHSTLYRGCEIALSTRKSYEYSDEIKAHEKALKEAKMKERYDGTAVVIRYMSFPVVTPMKTEAA